MILKTCTCCGEEKFLSSFHKARHHKNGTCTYKGRCKKCCKVRDNQYKSDNPEKIKESNTKSYLKHKEKRKAYSKDYASKHKEKLKKYKAQHREENPNMYREYDRKYAKENPEKISASGKRYRKNNPEKVKKMRIDWKAANPDYHKNYRSIHKKEIAARIAKYTREHRGSNSAKEAKRRATKLKATPVWSEIEEIKKMYSLAALFGEMFGVKQHVDHIIPLQGKLVCGLHCLSNLQILPATSNLSKSNKFEVN
ncbi:hypothetical protein KAR91_20520 [Candidatus Pacearchaeota archaeon]|nr:hypothetical protein [Candidatus Pacearchaeota archaeon]